MPIRSSRPESGHVVVAFVIGAVHVIAIYALMHFRPRAPTVANQSPVLVRFISESSERPQPQPPEVTPIVPTLDIAMPVVPAIDVPVAAPDSNNAIRVPVLAAAPVPAQQSSQPTRLIASVEYLREPSPRYPPQSRKLREQGLVVLRVLIDERGTACDVAIENSSGHERLDHAALEAIARAEFRPYIEDGIARRAMVLIPIEFSLSRNPARIAANGA